MRRRTLFILLCILACASFTTGVARSEDEPAPKPVPATPAPSKPAPAESDIEKQGIEALDWLAGYWVGGTDANGLEAVYTTPRGGEIASATKSFHRGRCVFFEYERFFEREGKVILNPYPRGNRSVEFELAPSPAGQKKAKFSNEKHDFPRHLTYERTGENSLRITLEGVSDGKPETLVLELRRP